MKSPGVVIPPVFNWLLPAQAPAAAVAIYASVYVFGVGAVPFILAVVAAALNFLLGTYFCLTQSRPGSYHLNTVPIWLTVCAGIWGGTLYYFARQVELVVSLPERIWLRDGVEQPLLPTWAKVGCAMTALNVFIDLTLLGIFILTLVKQKSDPEKTSFASNSDYTPYTPSRHSPFTHPSTPYGTPRPPSTPTPSQQQQGPPPLPQPPYDPTNRIDTILRLTALQHPSGQWSHTPELASLLKRWGGRELMAPRGPGITALTYTCLSELCDTVWSAQREGREHEVLSAGEMASLEGVFWDLRGAGVALGRARGWLGRG